MTVPDLCYTIWFSQRTGSTWFCEVLRSTGIAGRPAEYLNFGSAEAVLQRFGAADAASLLDKIHSAGSTPNGVFGIKQGYAEPYFGEMLDLIAGPTNPAGTPRLVRWQRAFPNHRHIFMTRRNKVRLAVSWWRAIQSREWHRRSGDAPDPASLADGYDAAAIDRLMQEAVLREAGIQEMFAEAGVVPFTLTYEDAVQDLQGSLDGVLGYLGLARQAVARLNVVSEKIADDVSEEWVQRFRRERQKGWPNRGW